MNLLKELFNKKSIYRVYFNDTVSGINLQGKTIDFGAKSPNASYYRHIYHTNTTLFFVDLHKVENDTNSFRIDLEEDFHLPTQYDNALLFNVLEHIYNHKKLLLNIHNALRKDGRIHGVVPFIFPYHADPEDYFRYTHTAIFRLLSESGYSQISVKPFGTGIFLVIANIITKIVPFRAINIPFALLFIGLDKIFQTRAQNSKFYLGLYFTATA